MGPRAVDLTQFPCFFVSPAEHRKALPSAGVTCGKSEDVKGDPEEPGVRLGNTHALRVVFGQDCKAVEVPPRRTPFRNRNARSPPREGELREGLVCSGGITQQ